MRILNHRLKTRAADPDFGTLKAIGSLQLADSIENAGLAPHKLRVLVCQESGLLIDLSVGS